ncbi:MAG: hypothetical protein ACXWNK_16110 [Vulcanimicrobiaceae bacterium]
MRHLLDALRRTRYDTIVAVLAAVAFGLAIAGHGIPALRQDWQWPYPGDQMRSFLVDAWSGWNTSGIGAPAPYPSSYLLAVPTWLSFLAFGSAVTLWLFLLLTGVIVYAAARNAALQIGVDRLSAISIGLFALFNPWVYAKVVAGHVIMVLAYGATFGLIRELARKPSRFGRLALWLTFSFGQLQFFMLAMLAVGLFAVKRTAARSAFGYGLLIALPSIFGIAANYSMLRQIPYTLVWQLSQSVQPRDALLLAGYFTGYTEPIRGISSIGMWVVVLLAAIGATRALRSNAARAIVVLTALFLVVAMGVRGPFAAVYEPIVLHVPGSGIFRELYDMLGYTAIGYALLVSIACRQLRPLRYAALGAAVILSAAWLVHPPSEFFVSRSAIPTLDIHTDRDSRFALFPPFQPVSYEGRGTGVDPDAFRRAGNVTPLNSYLRVFPADAALISYARSRDTRLLSALSVSVVAQRPWLSSDVASLSHQLAANASIAQPKSFAVTHIPYVPELTIGQLPQIGGLDSNIGAGNVFFGDAHDAAPSWTADSWGQVPQFTPVTISNEYIDLSAGWVDARLAYVSNPAIAQGLGGAATRSPNASLPLTGGEDALVYLSGALLSRSGTRIVASTHGYAWIRIPDGVDAVRCRGFCVVVGQSRLTHQFPLYPPSRPYTALALGYVAPWLVTTHVPSGAAALIRYNVVYHRAWLAWSPEGLLPHVRLDTTVNGWLLPPRLRDQPIVIVEYVAALQTVLEVLGTVAALLLVVAYVLEKIRAWRAAATVREVAPVMVRR